MKLNMKVEFLDDSEQVTEERKIPRCHAHQIQGLPKGIKKFRVTWLDENGDDMNEGEVYVIGTRSEIYELLEAKGEARNFLPITEKDPEESKYVLSEEGEFRRLSAV